MNLFYFVTIFSLLLAVLAVAEDTTSTTTSAAVASDVVEVEEGSLEAESRNLLIYRNLFKVRVCGCESLPHLSTVHFRTLSVILRVKRRELLVNTTF